MSLGAVAETRRQLDGPGSAFLGARGKTELLVSAESLDLALRVVAYTPSHLRRPRLGLPSDRPNNNLGRYLRHIGALMRSGRAGGERKCS